MAWPLYPEKALAPTTRDSFANHGDQPISGETWKRFLEGYEPYLRYIAYLDFKPLYPDVAEEVYDAMISRLQSHQGDIHRPKNDPNGKFRSVILRIYRCLLISTLRKNGTHQAFADRQIRAAAPVQDFVYPDERSEKEELMKDACAYILEYLSASPDELRELYLITETDIAVWKRRFIGLMSEEKAGEPYRIKQYDVSKTLRHVNEVLRDKIREFLRPFGLETSLDEWINS